MDLRCVGRRKPHTLSVKVSGCIDGGFEGKNTFDETLPNLILRILDVSILKRKIAAA